MSAMFLHLLGKDGISATGGDDVIKDEDYTELENFYKYKLTSKEVSEIEKIVHSYIKKYPYLNNHFENMIQL